MLTNLSQFKLLSINKTIQRPTYSTENSCTCAKQQNAISQNNVKPFLAEYSSECEQFSCQNCNQNMQKVSQLKKQNILLQYNNARLETELDEISKQNRNLKKKLELTIKDRIATSQSPNLITIKQDLEAQLFESKLLNQLLTICQSNKSQAYSVNLNKLSQCLVQKLALQEQLEQKTRIIHDTVLYPIYHYDQRIKQLRNAIVCLYKIVSTQNRALKETIRQMGSQIQTFKIAFLDRINSLQKKLYGQIGKQKIVSIKTLETLSLHKTVQKQNISTILEKQDQKQYVKQKYPEKCKKLNATQISNKNQKSSKYKGREKQGNKLKNSNM